MGSPIVSTTLRLVNSTTVVAVAGLVTTLAGGLGSAWLQGVLTARNAELARWRDLRTTAYVAASAFVEAIELNLQDLTRPPEVQSRQGRPDVPASSATGAQLLLVAPQSVVRPWRDLVYAWDWLFMNMLNGGPSDLAGKYHLDPDDPNVRDVFEAADALTAALRVETGEEALEPRSRPRVRRLPD